LNRRSVRRNLVHRFGDRRGRGVTSGGFLGRGGANAHGSGGAINPVHLGHGAVAFVLVGEFHEAVALGAARVGIRDDLGAANGVVVDPEGFLEKIIGYVGRKIAHEDGMFWARVGPALTDAERGPIEPEGLFGAGHLHAVVGLEHALRCRVGYKLDETVTLGLARHLVADDFDGENLAGVGETVAEVSLVHPILQIPNP